MNTYELNKIAGAVLGSILLLLVISLIGDILVYPHMLEKSVLNIDTGATETATAGKQEAAAAEPPLAAVLAAGNADKGAKVAKKCAACHSFEKDGPNKVGPHLYGVLGRDKASIADYNYSSALKELGGKWTYEDIYTFLKSPKDFAPGTKMTFRGLPKPDDRGDVIAYLRQQNESPPPLPKE